jgi:alpha-1,2-mannosyltransferase
VTPPAPGVWSRWSTRAGLVALAVAIALAIALLTAKGIGFDLGSYVLAARRFLAGASMYPDPATYAPGPFDQYVYPPPVILLFVPLAVIPFDAARLIWFLLLCGVAIALLVRLVSPLAPSARWWAAAAYVLFFPLLWDIQLGNVTLITLYVCVLAWDARDRWPLSGALAAAGIGVKLLTANLLVFLAVAARWRVLRRSPSSASRSSP